MIKMVWKFVLAMLRHQTAKWRGYEVFTPRSMLEYRDRVCAVCEENEEGQCRVCKCLVISKTILAQEECPRHKWSRVWVKK